VIDRRNFLRMGALIVPLPVEPLPVEPRRAYSFLWAPPVGLSVVRSTVAALLAEYIEKGWIHQRASARQLGIEWHGRRIEIRDLAPLPLQIP
jgi:hypothetical protein